MTPTELMYLIILMPFIVFGALYFLDLIRKILGYSRVVVLEKDGTHTTKWIRAKSKKEFELDGKKRSLDPKGRFIGPLGNLFVFVADDTKPLTIEGKSGPIDTDDISTMVRLSYFTGKLAGFKQFNRIEMLMYLNLGVLAVVVVFLLLYWQDRTKAFDMLREALARLKAISP